MIKNKHDLIDISKSINRNIKKYGLERYDLRDTRWIPFLLKKNFFNNLIRKKVLFFEELAPILVRKAIKSKKKCWPTTYTFLGNANLIAEKKGFDIDSPFKSTDYADMMLKEFIVNKCIPEWWATEPHVGMDKATIKNCNKPPTLLMHALTRANIMFIEMGNYYNKQEYIEVAVKSAQFVLDRFEIITLDNQKKSISYYYNTYDSTININSEYAHWLSMIPREKHTNNSLDMLDGIINLLLDEQNSDGSWFYYSKWHMEKYSEKPSCDCHHTGTVLYNLLNILKCDYIDKDKKLKIKASIDKGMKFYLKTFFDKSTGRAIYQVGYKRPAGPVQYSEAIFTFCEYLSYKELKEKEIYNLVKELLPKVVDINAGLINVKNGSAPSEKILLWKNINSIRWGNGPVLQSIMSYLSIYDEIYL